MTKSLTDIYDSYLDKIERLEEELKNETVSNDLLCEQIKRMDSELKELACKNDSLAMECGKIQEQLAEANEIIRYYDIKEPKYVVDGVLMGKDPAHIYCVKWGVK